MKCEILKPELGRNQEVDVDSFESIRNDEI